MDALTQSSESGYIVNHKQLERTMNRIFLTLLLVIITILMNITSARAVTLHWGSAVGDFIYESDGVTAVTDSAYEFELGTFTDGFTPSTENLADWANNWHTLDVGSYSSMNGYLAGSVSLSADPSPNGTITDGNATDTAEFFFGKDAYIWIYNQNTTIDSTLEWNLLSNPDGGGDPATAWTFPGAADTDARKVIDFRLSDDGVTTTFGRENQGTPSDGGGTNELGEVPSTPMSTFGLQTFTIPEPSAVGLLIVGLLALGFRRNRDERVHGFRRP